MELDLSHERFGRGVPHELFAHLRATSPVVWYESDAVWAVTTHALISRINRDPKGFSSAQGVAPSGDSGRSRQMLVSMDPPQHTDYRLMVNRHFTPRSIGQLDAVTRQIVGEQVATFIARGGGDFVADVASPVPFRVMARLLGMPDSDHALIASWTNSAMPSADPVYRPTPEAPLEARRAFVEYCDALVAEKRRSPGDDLTSQLLAGQSETGLTDDEISSFVETLGQGGTETTRHLLSNGLLALLEAPEQGRRFIEGEVDAAVMIEEMLRWTTPILHHFRRATADAEIGDVVIRQGDRVALWMVSGNRDENVFAHADRLDVGRTPNTHQALGSGGPHYCLGAPLARLEGRAVFEALRPHLASLSLSRPPARAWSSFFNGLRDMPIEMG